jgi:2-polyprenyl-3-methyl-5-hydroxy-6-metoxy-1,4-benzoquinol methylase
METNPTLPHPSLETITSQLCTSSQFKESIYHRLAAEITQPPATHRKQWEYIFILRALEQFGMLHPGRTGLGFGCGKEPLAEVMTKRGASVICTDIPPLEKSDAYWGSHGLKDSFYGGIVSWEHFESLASFRAVDMNAIPNDLGKHDFIWSSCALEHLGSLRHGIYFILDANKCLRPGGIAIHTTEFNLSSNDDTLESPAVSLYRKKDIQDLQRLIELQGNFVLPINFYEGEEELDKYVDLPPYTRDKHLRLLVEEKYVITSIALVVVKR